MKRCQNRTTGRVKLAPQGERRYAGVLSARGDSPQRGKPRCEDRVDIFDTLPGQIMLKRRGCLDKRSEVLSVQHITFTRKPGMAGNLCRLIVDFAPARAECGYRLRGIANRLAHGAGLLRWKR